jgi:hypothetical protein
MNKNLTKFLLILVISVALASLSLAQRQTGSIAGKVTDNEGIPLPGVSVTLSGPSLMGTLSYSTTAAGDFRFPSVPPGRDYSVKAEIAGFKIVTMGNLVVNVGRTTNVDLELEPTTLSEEITVTAPVPAVDVTSTKQAVTYSTELINNIPLARTYHDIIQSAPGTVGGGSAPRPHGSGYRTSLVQVDGATITDRALGSQGFQLPFDMIEEVELETGAHMAEVGMTEGAYVNIVSKSGGNEFHGSVQAFYFNEDMARSLLPDAELEAVGLTAPSGVKNSYDASAALGGPIIKDRLWFFTNGRISGEKIRQESIYDGEYDRPLDEWWGFLKLTFQLSNNIKITGMGSLRNYDQPLGYFNLGYRRNKTSARYMIGAKDYVGKGIINWILNQNTFIDVRFGGQGIYYPRYFHPDAPLPETNVGPMQTYDRANSYAYYGTCRWEDELNRYQWEGSASITHFMDNVLGGNHEWKAGFEMEKAWVDNPIWTPYAIQTQYIWGDSPYGYTSPSTPYRGRFRSAVIGDKKENWNLRVYMFRWAAYLQDSFTLKDRITINFGLRYNHSTGYTKAQKLAPVGRLWEVTRMLAPTLFKEVDFPAQDDMIIWKNFSPRIGISYDLFGDNTTSVKASWSRYALFLTMEYYINLSPAYPHGDFDAYWDDLDMDGVIETTDDFIIIYQPPDIEGFDWRDKAQEDLTVPFTDEIIVGIDREVSKDFSVGVSYIYKKWHKAFDTIEANRGYKLDDLQWYAPYTVTDPGEDGTYGTGDEQQLTVYGVKKGAPSSWLIMGNPEGFKKSYNGLEFVFNKRMSQGWQLLGSLTISKTYGNFDSGSGSGSSSMFNSPNEWLNAEGRLSWDIPLVIKLQGSFTLPLDFMVSGYFTHLSGRPFNRTLDVQLPADPDTFEYWGSWVSVNTEPPGTRRYRSQTNLDLRVEKIFRIGDFGRFGVFVDVLNVFGDSGYEVDQNPGGRLYNDGRFTYYPSYGDFEGAYGMRTYKVSARFTF